MDMKEYHKNFLKQNYKSVCLKKELWQRLMKVRSENPELRGISETIGFILKQNEELNKEENEANVKEFINKPKVKSIFRGRRFLK